MTYKNDRGRGRRSSSDRKRSSDQDKTGKSWNQRTSHEETKEDNRTSGDIRTDDTLPQKRHERKPTERRRFAPEKDFVRPRPDKYRKDRMDRSDQEREKRTYPSRENTDKREEPRSYGSPTGKSKAEYRDNQDLEKRKPARKESGEFPLKGEGKYIKPERGEKRFKKHESTFNPERKFEKRGDKKPYRKRETGGYNRSSDIQPEEKLTRLNKYIANSGICSRREADDLIKAGLVSVNGKIVTEMGVKIARTDIVKYNNTAIRRERKVYVLLNKPKDFITTTDDPEERKTVMNLVSNAGKERIYPVGRLDRNTTGLLLLTNDGELTKKLTHPSSNIKKIYHVELDKNLSLTDLQTISGGVTLEDGFIKVDEIHYDGDGKEKNKLGVALHSGKNRIVRRIFESLGYEVRKLDRVIFAGLTKKDLPRGKWRNLSEIEVNMLKMIAGTR